MLLVESRHRCENVTPIMSPLMKNELKEHLDGLQAIHRELEEAIDESLQMVWQLNDGLLTWLSLMPEEKAGAEELSVHFMAVSVWLEGHLFSNRNKPLCSKGVFRDLKLLEEAIESCLQTFVRGDVASQEMMLTANLSVLQIAPGAKNAALVSFADRVERLLEQDITPLGITMVFPDRLVPSLAAIIAYLQKQIVGGEEDSVPDKASEKPVDVLDPEFELPDLDDF